MLLTQVDKLAPLDVDLVADPSKLYQSRTVRKMWAMASDGFGIPACDILPVINYTRETEPTTAMDIIALKPLEALVDMCKNLDAKKAQEEAGKRREEVRREMRARRAAEAKAAKAAAEAVAA